MKVFADYHHGQLYHSLHFLFEERMKCELYRPIGLDWVTQGYWDIAKPYGNARDTIDQYLAIRGGKWDAFTNLNGSCKLKDNVYHIYEGQNDFYHHAITLDTFKRIKFDVIIATFPGHDKLWEHLWKKYQPQAKFIVQLGNEGQKTDAKNVISSVYQYQPKDGQNVFFYHQEFQPGVFKYVSPYNHKLICSQVMLLPLREIFLQYKQAMPDFTFKAHGQGAIDGNLNTIQIQAKNMQDSAFGWHIKPADGYGFIIHSWYASGRPVITRGSDYVNKTAGILLEDEVTCIDLDKRNFEDNMKVIRKWSEPENHRKMCQAAYERFQSAVDFDEEAKGLIKFISII
jgi:hypothetical protein